MDVKIIANILYLNNHPPIITSNSIKREEISKSLLAEKRSNTLSLFSIYVHVRQQKENGKGMK